jgi:hypothetical protein
MDAVLYDNGLVGLLLVLIMNVVILGNFRRILRAP